MLECEIITVETNNKLNLTHDKVSKKVFKFHKNKNYLMNVKVLPCQNKDKQTRKTKINKQRM